MHVIITCKYVKDRIKKKQPRKSGNTVFSIITLSVAMETSSRIWPNVKLIQALMYVIVTASVKWIRSRTVEKKWQHLFSHYKSMVSFFQTLKGS